MIMKTNDRTKLKLYFYIASILHVGFVIIAMTLTSRMIEINTSLSGYKFNITGGIFLIPIIFFIQDIVTEIYGYYNATKMLYCSLSIFAMFVITWYVISFIPCSNKSEGCAYFSQIAKTLPRHMISFIFSLAIGGTVNNYVLNKLKLIFNEKFLSLRFISATAIGEMIFQIIAVSISWFGIYSIFDILPLAIISYVYKILFEVVFTPANIYICRYLKYIRSCEINYVI